MEATEYFGDRAQLYAKFRPQYPDALISLLAEILPPPATIADIGSGTGILTSQLIRAGYTVFAVEPNAEMRKEAERRLSKHARFHSLAGSAEETSLPASFVEAITCAQSFHWFNRARCRVEFERVLRSPKLTVLIWNEEVLEGPMVEFTRTLRSATPEFDSFDWRNIDDEDFEAFFAPAPFERLYIANPQRLSRETFLGRFFSASHVPHPGQPGYEVLMEKMTAFFKRHARGGYLEFTYRTRVDLGRIH
jgi:SAM-dependent methyltransferase